MTDNLIFEIQLGKMISIAAVVLGILVALLGIVSLVNGIRYPFLYGITTLASGFVIITLSTLMEVNNES